MLYLRKIFFLSFLAIFSFLVEETQSVTFYYGDPKVIQRLVTEAVEAGFQQVKGAIEKQHWFLLREARLDKYTFRIRTDVIQYSVNYTSSINVHVFEVILNKATWAPELRGNRTYKSPPATLPPKNQAENPITTLTPESQSNQTIVLRNTTITKQKSNTSNSELNSTNKSSLSSSPINPTSQTNKNQSQQKGSETHNNTNSDNIQKKQTSQMGQTTTLSQVNTTLREQNSTKSENKTNSTLQMEDHKQNSPTQVSNGTHQNNNSSMTKPSNTEGNMNRKKSPMNTTNQNSNNSAVNLNLDTEDSVPNTSQPHDNTQSHTNLSPQAQSGISSSQTTNQGSNLDNNRATKLTPETNMKIINLSSLIEEKDSETGIESSTESIESDMRLESKSNLRAQQFPQDKVSENRQEREEYLRNQQLSEPKENNAPGGAIIFW